MNIHHNLHPSTGILILMASLLIPQVSGAIFEIAHPKNTRLSRAEIRRYRYLQFQTQRMPLTWKSRQLLQSTTLSAVELAQQKQQLREEYLKHLQQSQGDSNSNTESTTDSSKHKHKGTLGGVGPTVIKSVKWAELHQHSIGHVVKVVGSVFKRAIHLVRQAADAIDG